MLVIKDHHRISTSDLKPLDILVFRLVNSLDKKLFGSRKAIQTSAGTSLNDYFGSSGQRGRSLSFRNGLYISRGGQETASIPQDNRADECQDADHVKTPQPHDLRHYETVRR